MKLKNVIIIFLIVIFIVGCNNKVSNKKEKAVNNEITNKNEGNINNNGKNKITEKKETQNNQTSKIKENKENSEEKKVITLHKGQAVNPLTGLWINEEIAKRRPVAIMINNHKRAIPQSGISKADIIYEAPVEGGINRLLAVFQDFNVKKIGPLRSARRYFIDFAFDHDAIYVHYGKDPSLYTVFKKLKSPHLNGLSYLDTIMCWRDNKRSAPHNVYTKYEKLLKAWDEVGYRKQRKENFKLMFNFYEDDSVNKDGSDAKKITIPYSYYQLSEFKYDETQKMYKRFQFGKPHIDSNNNEQLSTKNIIIQYVNVYHRQGDKEGRLDMDLISSGRGYYISNGKCEDIKWIKTGEYEPTQWYTKDGNLLKINKGKTWICIVPLNIKVKFE